MKIFRIQVKSVYGKKLFYPMSEAADIFIGLTGKKTFSDSDLWRIYNLGFDIEETGEKSGIKFPVR